MTSTLKIIDEQTDRTLAALVVDGDDIAVFEGDPETFESVKHLSHAEAVACYFRLEELWRSRHARWINSPNPGQDTLMKGQESVRHALNIGE